MATRRFKPQRFPIPGLSREDQAKHVGRSYRDLVFRITQGQCDDPAGELHRLDWYWADHGHTWPQPHRPDMLTGREDEWMPAPDLAAALDRPRKDIYNWARLGHITQRCGPDGTPEYLVSTVIDYQRRLTQRRRGDTPPQITADHSGTT